jgi:phage-related protein
MSPQSCFVPEGGVGILANAQRTSRQPLAGLHHFWYTPRVADEDGEGGGLVLRVVFYRTEAGNEPVRQWLKGLERVDRKILGEDVKTAQYGWPLGMPLIRKLEPGLWEVRSHLPQGIARILFTVSEGTMVLLHRFVKKSQKTPPAELRAARQRLAALREE